MTLKIGLASYEFINNDIEFNLLQIEKALIKNSDNCELLCFEETFLQGFDSLNWDYELDKEVASTTDSYIMKRIQILSVKYDTALLIGFIEREIDSIFSSCIVVDNGEIIYNYRRITKNWKEYKITDDHYKEGDKPEEFIFRNREVLIALCGDLWIFPEKIITNDILIWPVYANFNLDEWKVCENEYAEQALLASRKTLMINSISKTPKSYGNSFYFENGKVKNKLDYDQEAVLIVEV